MQGRGNAEAEAVGIAPNRGSARERDRARPDVVAAHIAQHAEIVRFIRCARIDAPPVQGQGFIKDEVEGRRSCASFEREFQGRAAGHRGIGGGDDAVHRIRRAQRLFMRDAQCARVHRGLAAVGVGRREEDGARRGHARRSRGALGVILPQAAGPREDGARRGHARRSRGALGVILPQAAGPREDGAHGSVFEDVIVARVDNKPAPGQRAIRKPARVNNPAIIQPHAPEGILPARQVKHPARARTGDDQPAAGVDGVASAQPEFAALDFGIARVAALAAQREPGQAGLGHGQPARAGLNPPCYVGVAIADEGQVAVGAGDVAREFQGLLIADFAVNAIPGEFHDAIGAVNGGVGSQRDRAPPGVVAADIAQCAPVLAADTHALPVQGQAFVDIEIAAREFKGRAVAYGDGPSARAQRIGVSDGEDAGADRGRARVAAVAAEREPARAGLDQTGRGRAGIGRIGDFANAAPIGARRGLADGQGLALEDDDLAVVKGGARGPRRWPPAQVVDGRAPRDRELGTGHIRECDLAC